MRHTTRERHPPPRNWISGCMEKIFLFPDFFRLSVRGTIATSSTQTIRCLLSLFHARSVHENSCARLDRQLPLVVKGANISSSSFPPAKRNEKFLFGEPDDEENSSNGDLSDTWHFYSVSETKKEVGRENSGANTRVKFVCKSGKGALPDFHSVPKKVLTYKRDFSVSGTGSSSREGRKIFIEWD